MTDRKYSSNAQPTTLSADVNDSTTTIPVVATTGFPATPFTLALDYGTTQQEVVLVTGVAGTNLTVTRGYDSTTAQAHTLGAAVRHVHVGMDFRDSRTHESSSTGVHGVTGSVVGTTDTQALTHKDLTSGTNIFPASLATDAEVSAAASAAQSAAISAAAAAAATADATVAANAASALSTHAADTSTHGVSSEIVGRTEAQVLTNKDLTDPSNTLPLGLAATAATTTDVSATSEAYVQHLTFSAVNGAVYKVTAFLSVQSDTATADSFVRLKVASSLVLNPAGTQIAEAVKDHRVANRREAVILVGLYTADATATRYIKLTLESGGGGTPTSTTKGTVQPTTIIVERIA